MACHGEIGCYTISLHMDPDETLLCLWRPSFQSLFAIDTTQENFQFYEHFSETSKAWKTPENLPIEKGVATKLTFLNVLNFKKGPACSVFHVHVPSG